MRSASLVGRNREEMPDLASSREDYAARFSGPVGEFLLDVQSQALLSLIGPWAGGRALDVGGGHAQTVPPLLAAGMEVTVLGSRAESWGRAHERFKQEVEFASGSIIRPPFDTASFDLVTSFRMLAHVSSWREMIHGLCSVARHAVIVDFPVATSMKYVAGPLYQLKKRIEGNTRPFRAFAPKDVEAEFAKHGFVCTTAIRQFALPMVLHRTLGSANTSRLAERWLRGAGVTGRLGSPVILRAARERVPDGTGVSPSRELFTGGPT